MTFEDEKLVAAVETLKNTERECANDAGWLKSITSRVFRTEQDVMTTSGVSIFLYLPLTNYFHSLFSLIYESYLINFTMKSTNLEQTFFQTCCFFFQHQMNSYGFL